MFAVVFDPVIMRSLEKRTVPATSKTLQVKVSQSFAKSLDENSVAPEPTIIMPLLPDKALP